MQDQQQLSCVALETFDVMAANIQKKSVKLHKIPHCEHSDIKQAFDNGEWFWLIKKWNEHTVTSTKLCATCPDSIKVIKHYLPDLWQP